MSILAALLVAATLSAPDAANPFVAAAPTWPKDLTRTTNTFVVFKAAFDWPGGAKPVLRIAADTAYRADLNGRIAAHGPARAPAHFMRVDEWTLRNARPGRNELRIEVAGYFTGGFQYLQSESFLQAEVLVDGKPVLATPKGFAAERSPRAREGFKYSCQRGFVCERYALGGTAPEVFELASAEAPRTPLAREVPYPEFKVNDRFEPCGAKSIGKTYAAPAVDTGFIGVRAKVRKPGKVVIEFEEALVNGVLDPYRNGHTKDGNWHAVVNHLEWDILAPGDYVLETFEPYTLKYVAVAFEGGEAELSAPYVVQFRNPLPERAIYTGTDPELGRIFDAAKSTLAQNSVDILTDCPSRERCGWLCDSYFSAKAMAALTGDRSVERVFLEGLASQHAQGEAKFGAMPGGFPCASDCMTTYMCWYVIQAAEYAAHAGGIAPRFKAYVRPRVEATLAYLRTLKNADGLLENLPGWVFIEWSKANDLTKGVNYPANMLYAKALDAANELYGLPEAAAEATRIRAKVREQSFDGTWFHDQALRDGDGRLVRGKDITEVCQYYAFFTGTATPAGDPDLWRRTVAELGPRVTLPKGIWPADMFMGAMLRLALLRDFGRTDLIADDIKAYVGYQVAETGSLWEFKDGHDSRCHGFLSYVATFLDFRPGRREAGE